MVEVKREVDARVSAGRVDRRVDVDCRGQRVLLMGSGVSMEWK